MPFDEVPATTSAEKGQRPVNPWEAHQWPTPPGHPPPPTRPRPMGYPPRQSWPGRGTAVTTIVLSGVNAGLGLLVALWGASLWLMIAPWILAGPDEPPADYVPPPGSNPLRDAAVLLLKVPAPFFCYSVLFFAAAILLLLHKLIGRRLVVAASLIEIAVLAAWAAPPAPSDWPGLGWPWPTGWVWAVGMVIPMATMICALLPGTRRWCTKPTVPPVNPWA
jgi:hypothetical protein